MPHFYEVFFQKFPHVLNVSLPCSWKKNLSSLSPFTAYPHETPTSRGSKKTGANPRSRRYTGIYKKTGANSRFLACFNPRNPSDATPRSSLATDPSLSASSPRLPAPTATSPASASSPPSRAAAPLLLCPLPPGSSSSAPQVRSRAPRGGLSSFPGGYLSASEYCVS